MGSIGTTGTTSKPAYDPRGARCSIPSCENLDRPPSTLKHSWVCPYLFHLGLSVVSSLSLSLEPCQRTCNCPSGQLQSFLHLWPYHGSKGPEEVFPQISHPSYLAKAQPLTNGSGQVPSKRQGPTSCCGGSGRLLGRYGSSCG